MADGGEGADYACAQMSEGTLPVCLEGECVPCSFAENKQGVCEQDLEVCGEENTCEQCSFHDQCITAYGSGCRMETGRCLLPASVWHVDGSMGGDGTRETPFETIGEALALIGPGSEGTIVLHEHSGMSDSYYEEAIQINEGRAVAIVAYGDGRPQISAAGGGNFIAVHDQLSFGYFDGLRIEDGDSIGLLASSYASVYLDRCEVVTGGDYGVWTTNATMLHMRNSTVWADNGSLLMSAVRIQGDADILYTTVFNASADEGAVDLVCDGPVGTQAITVRNSTLISHDDALSGCPDAVVTNSTGTGIPPGVGNQQIPSMGPPLDDPLITGLFVEPFEFGDIDLRLTGAGATSFMDVPLWQPTDPPFDIDRNPRPSVGGTDYAGAHVP